MADFAQTITTAYATDGAALDLGRGVHDGAVVPAATVKLPLRMVNRHGLIAGATGTGKTKTLQGIAEQLSAAGVPVFVADVKGDLSGVAEPGDAGGAAAKRAQELGLQFQARGFPVEFFALGGIGPGIPIRATVSDFGPQLLAKVLGANDTQEQSLTLVFHYADAKGLPLLDLSDLRALLSFLASAAGKADLTGIGGLSSATVGVLLRSLTGLEDGGGTEFFGEPMLDVHDLMRTAQDGRGIISCLELPAVQDKPTLFSTALMWLLAQLFEELPEAGDLDKPKLAFFFDEAHLLFDDATKAFLTSVAQTVRLIRSKGVGVYFVTQTPKDVPSEILGQLGNRVQHALRAFTPEDAKALKATVSTFPKSAFYDLEALLTGMGIGEAAVTILSESGVPTPVVQTRMTPPASRMGPADDVDGKAKASPLWAKYGQRVDNESAREILAARMAPAAGLAEGSEGAERPRPPRTGSRPPSTWRRQAPSPAGWRPCPSSCSPRRERSSSRRSCAGSSACSRRRCSGSRTTARRPGPASLSDTEPPCASAVDRTMARPRPAPSSPALSSPARLRASSRRENRPKARSASSAGIPGPSSDTVSTAHPPSSRTDTHTWLAACRTALSSRFTSSRPARPDRPPPRRRRRLGPHRHPGRGVARRDRFAHRGQVGGLAAQVLPVQPREQQQVLGQPGQPQRVGVHVARRLRPSPGRPGDPGPPRAGRGCWRSGCAARAPCPRPGPAAAAGRRPAGRACRSA